MGHRGQDPTLSIVCESFWWKGMGKSIREFVSSCLHCMVSRSGGSIPRPLSTAIHGTKPNHMDYLYMGPSYKGATYLLIFKDDLSSYIWLWPTNSATSEEAADALTTWIGSFGCMDWLVSDQGTHFKNELLGSLASETHTKHHFTTTYTPWANGMVERVCREVLRASRVLLSELKLAEQDWPAVSECIQSIINGAPLRRLGRRKNSRDSVYRSQIEVFTGHKLMRPLIRALPIKEYRSVATMDEIEARQLAGVQELQDSLHKMHGDIAGLGSKSRKRSISKHNEKTNVLAVNFKVGDWVLVSRARMATHKLSFIWRGPYRIVECKSDLIYIVESMNRSHKETIHICRLILDHAEMDGKPVSEELLKASEHLTTKYHVMEAIQDISVHEGNIQLNIERQGLPDRYEWTWERLFQAFEDIPDEVQIFLETLTKRKLKEQAKRQLRLS